MFNLKNYSPEASVVNTLVSNYSSFFNNITLLLGDRGDHMRQLVPPGVDAIECESNGGVGQHKCLSKCIKRHDSHTKGFLYVSDDMFVNLTRLASRSPNEIWFVGSTHINYSQLLSSSDWLWGPPHSNAKKLDTVLKSFPANWMASLHKNAGYPDKFSVKAISDIIYVPKCFATQLAEVLDHIALESPELHCEVATILAVNTIANRTEVLKYGYLWHKGRTLEEVKRRVETADFVHPMKLSNKTYSSLWLEYMDKQLASLS